MRTSELLANLQERQRDLQAELKGITAAIEALGGRSVSTGRKYTCSICGQTFTASKKAWICRKVECRTERKRQTAESKITGRPLAVPIRKQRPRGTVLVKGAQK